jgi:hypothetical protein
VPDRPHPGGWARCLPSANHCKGEREWNHYRVEANDGRITLAVNGHVVSGVSKCKPRKGYLALESEGSECHFKNLKIKELPSTNPKPDEIADQDKGLRKLYAGLDLSGWKADDGARRHWQPKDTVLHYDGKGEAKDNSLRTEQEYGDAEYSVDFRFLEKGAGSCSFGLRTSSKGEMRVACMRSGAARLEEWAFDGTSWNRKEVATPAGFGPLKPAGQWNRLRLTLKDTNKRQNLGLAVTLNGRTTDCGSGLARPSDKDPFVLRADGAMDFANLFGRELK